MQASFSLLNLVYLNYCYNSYHASSTSQNLYNLSHLHLSIRFVIVLSNVINLLINYRLLLQISSRHVQLNLENIHFPVSIDTQLEMAIVKVSDRFRYVTAMPMHAKYDSANLLSQYEQDPQWP